MRKIFLFGFFLPLLFLITPSSLQAAPDSAPSTSSGQILPEVKKYDDLLTAIRGARAGSRARVEKAVEKEKVREAWEIGKLIDEHVLQHKERADYGKQVILRLSKDLSISDTELYYMLQFARTYPNFRAPGKLSWGQYEILLSVNDPAERAELEEKAAKENWTQDQTRAEVKKRKVTEPETSVAEKLTPLYMGQPGTYKIILAQTGPYRGELALDLGFSSYFRLSEIVQDLTEFNEGDLVSFNEKEIQLLGQPRGTDPESLLYVYEAWVLRVLDGDTIEAVIDLGFGITTTQTLRLRGIDCPELVSREGQEAKEFVEKMLIGNRVEGKGDKETKTGSAVAESDRGAARPSVFIRTSKSDKYDRYLVDIFFTGETGEDEYLNNKLLEKGLAARVRD